MIANFVVAWHIPKLQGSQGLRSTIFFLFYFETYTSNKPYSCLHRSW